MNLQTPSAMDTEAGPGEVGGILRASRLRQGQELSDVARALRIRIVYLQAIEDHRYEDLPGLVYAIGFIRSYADHLGLDGEQLVTRFKTEASGQRRKPIMTYPPIVAEGGVPRGAIITLGAVILIAAYGGWYVLSSKNLYVTDLIPPVPESITRAFERGRATIAEPDEAVRTGNDGAPRVAVAARPAPAPVEATPNPTAPAPNTQPVPVADVPVPAGTPPLVAPTAPNNVPSAAPPNNEAAAPSAPTPVAASSTTDEEVERTPPPSAAAAGGGDVASPAPAAPVSGAAPSAPAREAAPVALDDRGGVDAPAVGSQLASLPPVVSDPNREIVLKATVDSWIQIRDTNENRLVLTRLLRKGEQYTVPPQPGLSLVTGNAGGLEVTVGGSAIPSLGPIGEVRRDIALDPDLLRAGAAIRQ